MKILAIITYALALSPYAILIINRKKIAKRIKEDIRFIINDLRGGE